MRQIVFWMTTLSSALALVGFAGTAQASATIDLIWIDVSDVDGDGNPICLRLAERNCPRLGTMLSSVAVTDNITLGVIITAGRGGLLGAGVSVDYRDALPTLSVIDFARLDTELYLPARLGVADDETLGWVQNINAVALIFSGIGIGLPAGQSAYLGTVTFHKDRMVGGLFEIGVGVDGPIGTDGVLSLFPHGAEISSTSTFNSAFLVQLGASPSPTATPTATPTPVVTPTPTPMPSRSGRVTVCHHGKRSITTAPNGANAHLAHGDTMGACP
jgi:hypothetical protein